MATFARTAAHTSFCGGEFSGRTSSAKDGKIFGRISGLGAAARGSSRQQVMAMSFLSKLGIPGFGSKSTAENGGNDDSVLGWARKAKVGCPPAPESAPEGLDIATFAGGCFWGLQLAFDRLPGVVHTTVGYTGGQSTTPTYESVCSGRTGHAEAVQAYFDPKEVSYEQLLDCFFQNVDPTTRNRQGGDIGTQYRSAVYYHSPQQKAAAERKFAEVNEKLAKSAFRRVMGSKVVSELEPATVYYVAERYHQKYLEKGGRFGLAQSAEKGCTDKIRCYG